MAVEPWEGSHDTIGNGRTTVTTGGTAVQVSATSTACRQLVLTAETDNTGYIVVGSSTVVAALATRAGTPLAAGDTLVLNMTNLNQVYIDTTVDGDGVTYMYVL